MEEQKEAAARLNFQTGEFEDCIKKSIHVSSQKFQQAPVKVFEQCTVAELKGVWENFVESKLCVDVAPTTPNMSNTCTTPVSGSTPTPTSPTTPSCANADVEPEWYDQELAVLEDDPPEEHDVLNMNWRSEPENWQAQRWVKVDSVVDSGSSAPVAPPSMAPNVPIVPSEGSKRGQKYTSASKHKLKNLGQQHIKACTESGNMTEVLFQVADVSKPLVSVSAICEMGNRVIFGKSGGVVKNLKSGAETPFYRRNGIYILSLWLQDDKEQPFHRP